MFWLCVGTQHLQWAPPQMRALPAGSPGWSPTLASVAGEGAATHHLPAPWSTCCRLEERVSGQKSRWARAGAAGETKPWEWGYGLEVIGLCGVRRGPSAGVTRGCTPSKPGLSPGPPFPSRLHAHLLKPGIGPCPRPRGLTQYGHPEKPEGSHGCGCGASAGSLGLGPSTLGPLCPLGGCLQAGDNPDLSSRASAPRAGPTQPAGPHSLFPTLESQAGSCS